MFGTAQCFAKKTKKQAAYQHKYLIPAVKHNSSEVVIWACFAPCRTAKAWLKLGMQQDSVSMFQLKSRPQPNLNTVAGS